ncbi:MAG: PHP domain-containing protein [Eubacteriales bacterium]|nr:PHP domain-containing protein [Eubacteriales bacterium]
MKYFADLHIHSCLSPCGGEDMTPNNIVNMALLKGLDIIAVTDHNTARNLPAVDALAREAGLCLVPGLEVTTAEDVHMLTYFPDVERALAFSDEIYGLLPDIPLNARFFGEQTIMNEEDEPVGSIDRLLISALSESIEQLTARARRHGGVCVPAHIDKESHGIIALLGFINPHLGFRTVEVSPRGVAAGFSQYDPRLKVLSNSDAHDLGLILERVQPLELAEKSAACFLKYLDS